MLRNRTPLRLVLGVFAATCAAVSDAGADTVLFDFESTPATYISPPQGSRPGALTSLVLSESGLTLSLSRENGAAFDIVQNSDAQSGKPASFGERSVDPFFAPGTSGFIGNLSSAVSGVSLDFGDYGADADTLTLSAYSGLDGTGTLLATTTVDLGTSGFPTFATASVAGAQILSFTIMGTSSALGFENSVFLDNFTFTTTAAVPEPSSLALIGIAASAGLGAWSRKQRAVRRS
ncbi:PEP-CTERM sorting domain-containing protein [Paludisphaera mucosa]|uniref:PEP-CTERM sorting domain-containing protein n=1 Tax=Paludisphaera mucosa TaxID=3030827 RepID=A0ABT6FHS6_9BACT|nr:PEP-CTERM sorting domain-containing protein [Paludisphaera mucosa]MDG3006940.1 PEP-CTERM sorting domain-containing protein [Paludisphaera mucosa]